MTEAVNTRENNAKNSISEGSSIRTSKVDVKSMM
jgi:hypothetical protein